jgi:hypothetical protein
MKAGGPFGGPSVLNRIGHIWQRKLHCPTGSIWTKLGSGMAVACIASSCWAKSEQLSPRALRFNAPRALRWT